VPLEHTLAGDDAGEDLRAAEVDPDHALFRHRRS
jgi:hypothetical protein